MSSNIERKLAAIMFTDIAGYTALSARDENKALGLLDKQEEILTPIIQRFNGTLHKKVGDGLLHTFPTVTEAIKCAISIQKETQKIENFIGQKPESLLQRIVEMITEKNDIVLDFFGGSGTTGAVAHKMGRQYILIEQMDYIKDLPEARLRKVIDGEQGGISKSVN